VSGSKDYSRTSKGWRHRSQIHHVKGGSHVRHEGRAWSLRAHDSEMWQPIDVVSPPDAGQEAQGGWKSWVDWQSEAGTPIATFVASWVVPPAPTVANGQLIYLFNGLQDSAADNILQPVLQWGTSPAQGSGNAWGLASFWVGQKNDPMFCSEWVPVASGTSVTGRMTVVAQDNGLFSTSCQFDGYPGTRLTAEDLPSLTDCVLTLEAYGTGPNAPYPDVRNTAFTAVNLTAGGAIPPVNWTAYGAAIIKTNGGSGGDVQVVYPANDA
jgi:hypothetical protein